MPPGYPIVPTLSSSSSDSSYTDNDPQISFRSNHTTTNINNTVSTTINQSTTTTIVPHAAARTPSIDSRDSSMSSLTNLSKKLSINTKNSIPDSFNKLSNKFKRTNSISSGNLFTRKPSISIKSNDSPNSSIHSTDDLFDFDHNNSNNNNNNNSNIFNAGINNSNISITLNTPSSTHGNLKRINSWSNNHLHKNNSNNNNNNNNNNNTTSIISHHTPASSSSSASAASGMNSTTKPPTKNNFFNNEIENLKFRSRANSSPQQAQVSRKSSISLQNLNIIKKKNLANTNTNNNNTGNTSANTSIPSHVFDSDKHSNSSSNDISDEYFSKNRVDSSQEFYLDNLDSFDIDIDNINNLSNLNLNAHSNTTHHNTHTVSNSMTSPLTLNSYKFGTPELKCEAEFDSMPASMPDMSTSVPDLISPEPMPPTMGSALGIETAPQDEFNFTNPSFPGWSLKDGVLVPNE